MAVHSKPLRSQVISGTAYLALVSLIIGVLVLKGAGTFDKAFPASTEVATVGGGLPVGADVKLRGLRVGEVSAVDVRRDGALVSIEIDPEFADAIPASVESRILTANVFGVPFVELVPNGPETPTLARNAQIPADTSKESVELASLYETAYDVLVAIEPAKLNSTLTAIASALQGQGDELRTLIHQSATYLTKLTPHRRQFERNLDQMARILTRVDASDEVLMDAIDNIAHVAGTMIELRQELADLMAVGQSSVNTLVGVVRQLEPRIIAMVRTSAPVFATLAANQGSPLASLLALGKVARGFLAARDPNGGITVRALIEGVPFSAYTSADCPRYGSLAGPNCGSVPTKTAAYAGASGPVGSDEERATIVALTDSSIDTVGLVTLVAGPALRGQVVTSR